MIEVNLLVLYLFIVLAFVGGFATCAVLTFGRQDSVDAEEGDTHA